MARAAVAYLRPPAPLPDGPPRDLRISATFSDTGADRQGLTSALEAIAAGEADTLYVQRLGAVAGSLREVLRLVDWLGEAGASLVAADVGLDTGAGAGARTLRVLREIERWGREPEHPKRPRGRPGIAAGSPELGERIAALREEGLSLAQIAERLNAAGVPTPRGGARWRPSSVQSALGYRRPGPPAPGAGPGRRPLGPGPGPGPKRKPGPHGPGRAKPPGPGKPGKRRRGPGP